MIAQDIVTELTELFIEADEIGTDDLSPKELAFYRDVRDRFNRFGGKLYLSEAQLNWLRAIRKKVNQ